MFQIIPDDRKKLKEAALGKRDFDLVIKNIRLVNVFTGEVYPAEIGIYEGFIAHIEPQEKEEAESLSGKRIFKGKDYFAVPGLIDSHVHLESSLMTPDKFAQTVVPRGTTTVISDPHEIANVMGLEGVKYMLKRGQEVPQNQFILSPSCVPSAPQFEKGGANFGKTEIEEILSWEGVIGLAEVMDYPGVIYSSKRMEEILEVAEKKGVFIQGHSPGLSGRELSAYLCGGPQSDHEITETMEAREKMRMGMIVDGRESSISQDLEDVIPALPGENLPPNFTLCTDDREPDDLLQEGQMDYVVRRAIEEGMNPISAIRAATCQVAKNVGLHNLGALAPGYTADIVLTESLEKLKAEFVFYRGEKVGEKGKFIGEIQKKDIGVENKDTIYLDKIGKEDFILNIPEDWQQKERIPIKTISYPAPDTLFTELKEMELSIKKEKINFSEQENINLLAVFNRYQDNDSFSRALIHNFGLQTGAVASTVSHDCHNLTVVACDPEDGVLAANEVINSGGGIVCVKNGKVLSRVPLPVAGLMSNQEPEQVAQQVKKSKQVMKKLGLKDRYPLLKISTLTLAVIPEVKMTDQGLVDVVNQSFISLFPDRE